MCNYAQLAENGGIGKWDKKLMLTLSLLHAQSLHLRFRAVSDTVGVALFIFLLNRHVHH